MTSSAFFNSPPATRRTEQRWWIADRSGHDRWGGKRPPTGRISGRQWGIPMAASGENYMAAVRSAHRQGSQHRRPTSDHQCCLHNDVEVEAERTTSEK